MLESAHLISSIHLFLSTYGQSFIISEGEPEGGVAPVAAVNEAGWLLVWA